jgi:hypothetical protein
MEGLRSFSLGFEILKVEGDFTVHSTGTDCVGFRNTVLRVQLIRNTVLLVQVIRNTVLLVQFRNTVLFLQVIRNTVMLV